MVKSIGFNFVRMLEANGKLKVAEMENLDSVPSSTFPKFANFASFPTSPDAGNIVLNEETRFYHFWDGTSWKRLESGDDNVSNPKITTIPPTTLDLNTDGSTNTISIVASDSDGDILSYSYDISQSGSYYSPERGSSLPQQLTSIAAGYETTGNFVLTPSTDTNHGGSFIFRSRVTDGIKSASANTTVNLQFTVDPGGHLFNATGSHTWTCPSHVEEVSVVCIGGGGGGGAAYWSGGGGGGGGLGWKNNISVVPGQSYTVVVGSGGSSQNAGSGGSGGQSYFISSATVKGSGGVGGTGTSSTSNQNYAGGYGGGYTGDGGGSGGLGGTSSGDTAGAGGGAGGYSGSGGRGSGGGSYTNGSGGGGSGGSGGGGNSSNGAAPSGGGVGIYGQGSSGGSSSAGGSGGTSGSSNGTSGGSSNTGGQYGGGGGGQSNDSRNTPGCQGKFGAVRIIWGTGRSFPSTNTSLAFSNTGDGESTN